MNIKAWIQAFRLRTLPLAFSSIFLGALLAFAQNQFNVLVLVFSLLTTLFLQILSNLANDYGDAESGVDGKDRLGPSRTVQAGLISQGKMKRALFLFAGLSLVSGVLLLFIALGDQWLPAFFFFILGIAAIAAAIKYTIGTNPYGYVGFGDLFVLIFFGWVGVSGSYYLQTSVLDWSTLLAGTSCGLLAVGVLNLNNIRDIESDQKSGKRSIPVRLGRRGATIYHGTLLVTAMVSAGVYNVLNPQGLLQWSFLIVIPLFLRNMRAVIVKQQPRDLDPYLKQLAISTLLFCLIFGFGQVDFGL